MTPVSRLSRIILICRSANSLAEFYREVLGFLPVDEAPKRNPAFAQLIGVAAAWITRLRLGGQIVELAQTQPSGRRYPDNVPGFSPLFQHFAIVVSDAARAYRRLQAAPGWKPISIDGPQTLPVSSGGVTAFKFRDPEGHPLELLTHPADATPAAWASKARALHLGIDHSAISVADTSRSEAFYSRLGLTRVGGSLNFGPQQQKLDALAEAVVEVTALAPAMHTTPHVELLCYRGNHPRSEFPPKPNDVAATQLVFEAERDVLDALVAAHREAIVSGPLSLPGGGTCVLLRDPDGHLLSVETRRGDRA